MEHVISDMNACSVHLFSFFKSKLFLAEQRFIRSRSLLPTDNNNNNNNDNSSDNNNINMEELITEEGHLVDNQKRVILEPIFEAWKLPEGVRQSAEIISMATTLRSMDRHHTDLLRHHFDQIGRSVYSSLYSSA